MNVRKLLGSPASFSGAMTMAALSFGVVVLDLVAMAKWPVHDTPGMVGKALLLALAGVEFIPCSGFLALAAALRVSPGQPGPRTAFWLLTVLALPVMALGAWVAMAVFQR